VVSKSGIGKIPSQAKLGRSTPQTRYALGAPPAKFIKMLGSVRSRIVAMAGMLVEALMRFQQSHDMLVLTSTISGWPHWGSRGSALDG